jgi:hypothetical protein
MSSREPEGLTTLPGCSTSANTAEMWGTRPYDSVDG